MHIQDGHRSLALYTQLHQWILLFTLTNVVQGVRLYSKRTSLMKRQAKRKTEFAERNKSRQKLKKIEGSQVYQFKRHVYCFVLLHLHLLYNCVYLLTDSHKPLKHYKPFVCTIFQFSSPCFSLKFNFFILLNFQSEMSL